MAGEKKRSNKHQPLGLEILFEDRDILVINKSAGLLTMGTGQDAGRTAYAALTDYVRKGNPKSPHRIFIVHRLDRDTSGLLVFARTEQAKLTLQENWHDVEKRYLTVVEGIPPKSEDTISSNLTENSAGKMYSSTQPGVGKLSHTRYKVLEQRGDRTLVEITLLTGRKNQIRVHLADIGCPIVGDIKYGKANRRSKRLALHAHNLRFAHPFNGRTMEFTAPPPPSFHAVARHVDKPADKPNKKSAPQNPSAQPPGSRGRR